MKYANVQQQQGFTLIEIIVSLAIFAMVAVVAIGAFLKIIDANKKSQSIKTAVNNMNYAVEAMSREMRVGKNYHCETGESSFSFTGGGLSSTLGAQNCPIGSEGNVLAFSSSEQKPTGVGATCYLVYVYRFHKVAPTDPYGTLEKAQQESCGESLSSSDFHPIVSTELKVSDFAFQVDSESPTLRQPKIIIRASAVAGVKEKDKTYFDLQTTISQRIMN